MSFDFINNWLDWSETLRSPRLLRLWAGIGILSAILSRHVWIRANIRYPPLFPNLFIMLVAPPRRGKDMAINAASRMCRLANAYAMKKYGAPIIHFGGHSISPKGILDLLKDAEMSDTATNKFHSLSFFVPELTTVLPEYDAHLIGILNELWNCNEAFGERVRGTEFIIDNPHVTMLMGNQPSTLYRIFPESVFQMGFTARVFFIYSNTIVKKKAYLEKHEEAALDNDLEDHLIKHLAGISQWAGQLDTTKGFRDAVNAFDELDPSPVPGRRFEHWNGGRGLNAQKLAMCLAASKGERIISAKHWERAVEFLFEAEKVMPLIFENVVTDRGFSEDVDSLSGLVANGEEISQYRLLAKLSKTRPPHEVAIIIDQAVKAGILSPVQNAHGGLVRPARYLVNELDKFFPILQ